MRIAGDPSWRKAEIQAGEVWGQQASVLLKGVMESRGWGFRQLSEQLATVGADMTAPAINRRINRGNFTAGFLLMCLEAMGAKLEVRSDDPKADPRPYRKDPTTAKTGVETLEMIIGAWADDETSD